jgi:hypothetical protein
VLTGVWQQVGGWSTFYVRELKDGTVWWFEYSEALHHSRVFRGRRDKASVVGSTIGVPLEDDPGRHQLVVDMVDGDHLRLHDDGRDVYRVHTGFPTVSTTPSWRFPRTAAWLGVRGGNISGTYQQGATQAVYWVGEAVDLTNPATQELAWVCAQPDGAFGNVFRGTRTGRTFSGEWADLPGLGNARNHGALDEVRVIEGGTLAPGHQDVNTEVGLERGDPRSRANRVRYSRFQHLSAQVHFQTFTLEFPSEGTARDVDDDPFLWVGVGMFDGRTAGELGDVLTRPGARPTGLALDGTPLRGQVLDLVSGPVSQGNLGYREWRLGQTVAVPAAMGRYSVPLETLRGLNPDSPFARSFAQLQVLAIGMEEDAVIPRDVFASVSAQLSDELLGKADAAVQRELGVLRSFEVPDVEKIEAALDAVFADARSVAMDIVLEDIARTVMNHPEILAVVADPPDVIGHGRASFDFNDLAPDDNGHGGVHPFSIRLTKTNRRGSYRVDGTITVTNGLRRIYRRPGGYHFVRLEGYVLARPREDGSTTPICQWFSEGRHDTFTTTDPAYTRPASSPRARIEPDYVLEAVDAPGVIGHVFTPERSRPPGCVPLRRWWSSTRQDNFTTSDPAYTRGPSETIEPGYVLPEHWSLEGYVYDPRQPRPPGARPLVSWSSRSTADNRLTTHPAWVPR